MTDQEILEGAESWATECRVFDSSILQYIENPFLITRSLSDIRELVELRAEVAKYRKAEKAKEELNEHLGIGGDV
jgi:hypothetical protein